MRSWLCAVLVFMLNAALLGAAELVWDFSKPEALDDWVKTRHLTAIQENDALVLNVSGRDSNITSGKLKFDPKKYPRIRITYSATGFPEKTTGEIFFTGKVHKVYTPHYLFTLPSLISDGQEHVMEVDARVNIVSGQNLWFNEKEITGLRLDLVNEFPGTIRLKKVEVLSDSDDNTTAWDFTRPQPAWQNKRHLTASPGAEGLLLNITGADSNIANDNLNIDPKKYGRLRIVYSATGFNGMKTTGEIFFAGEKHADFTEGYFFRMPPLQADGKTHVIELDANKNIDAGGKLWFNEGTIKKLRMDLVNQFPGKILLKKVEFLAERPAPLTSLNEININNGWYYPLSSSDFKIKLPRGRYNIWMHGADNINNALAGLKKLPGFAPSGAAAADVWHKAGTLTLNADREFNLALGDCAAGILFTTENSPVAARESGIPQQVKVDLLKNREPKKYLTMDMNMPYWQSKMIAPAGLWYHGGHSLVRRAFNLRTLPAKAYLQIMADDHVNEIYVNGTKIRGLWTQDWKYPSIVEVSKYLKTGKNVLGIKYTNAGGIGGLMFDLTCQYGVDRDIIIAANGSERVSYLGKEENWAAVNFNDSKWRKAEFRNGPPYEPWSTYIMPYTDYRTMRGDFTAKGKLPENMKSSSDLKLTVTFNGTPAIKDDEIFYVHLYTKFRTRDTRPYGVVSGKLKDFNPVRNSDNSISVTVSGFPVSQYGGEVNGVFDFGIYNRNLKSENQAAFSLPPRVYPGSSSDLIVKNDGKPGSPTITVNGKPFFPIWLDVFYDKFPTGLTGKNSPANVRTFLAGGNSNEWWLGPEKYDFSKIDEKISTLIRDYPDSYISAWVWCQPPHWYDEVYPDRISKQSDGKVFPYYVSTVTFSDEDYRRDAAKAVRALVEHCEKYFGAKMFCYNLCGGISLEWQGWGCHSQGNRKVLNDYSPSAQRDFVKFAAERYPQLNLKAVPSYEERVAPADSIFRHPTKEIASIVFDEYYSESIADCIAYIAKEVKDACGGNRLVGAYYGYFFEYGSMAYCLNGAGHNAVNRLLKSKDIDFLLSPPSYSVRTPGEPSADMKVFYSVMQAGKFTILEDDSRTHLTPPDDHHQTLNAEQTANILRRNWGMSLARRNPICLLTISDGREFSSPAIRSDLHKVQAAGQKLFESDAPSGVEVAIVFDEHSLKYLRPSVQMDQKTGLKHLMYGHHGKLLTYNRVTQNITGELTSFQRIPISQVGCGVDFIYVDDVPALADKYKFWVFASNYAASDKLAAAVDALKQRDVTMLVAYGAGFAGKTEAVDAKVMSDLLGMNIERIAGGSLKMRISDLSMPGSKDLHTVEIGGDDTVNPRFAVNDPAAKVLGYYTDNSGAAFAEKQLGKMKLVFYGGVRLTPDMLRMFARQAGVFINHDGDDTYFAGYGIHTIHAARQGKKVLKFPRAGRIVDIFSGEVLASGTDTVTLNMKAHDTRVLRFE